MLLNIRRKGMNEVWSVHGKSMKCSSRKTSSTLGTYWPGEFLFQYPIILPFHTVHGVLKARILKWFAIPLSSGPHSVRPLHHDPSVLGGPKAREFQKNIYFCFIDYAKAFDCVDHNKLWKILKEMGKPDHLTCLLRNLHAGQEATVRTGHGTRLVPNRKRSTSRLYIVTLLIWLLCKVHHEKLWAGWITSWNQDCREKYQ